MFNLQREDGTRQTLPSFLFDYLQKRFGVEQMMVEWAYNLQDASERFAHDERMGTFFGILTGAVSCIPIILIPSNNFV